MTQLVAWIDRITARVAELAGWSCFILVILICLDVGMRYLLNSSFIWMMELEIYLFAMVFMLGSAYALQKDKHVRVDVFYDRWSERTQAWIDLSGTVLLLLPWTCILIWVGWQYTRMSWLIGEGSAQPGGLPALYILKALIPLGMLLLGLQGISLMYHSIQRLRK